MPVFVISFLPYVLLKFNQSFEMTPLLTHKMTFVMFVIIVNNIIMFVIIGNNVCTCIPIKLKQI